MFVYLTIHDTEKLKIDSHFDNYDRGLVGAFQSYFIGNIFARAKRCIFTNYPLILSLLNLREYGYF